jgi:hypothetical protein
MVIINLDDPNVWLQACEQQTTLFWSIMSMAMEILAIVEHQDTLCYAIIWGGGYWPWTYIFKPKNYMWI